jgi:hypothetical protein
MPILRIFQKSKLVLYIPWHVPEPLSIWAKLLPQSKEVFYE